MQKKATNDAQEKVKVDLLNFFPLFASYQQKPKTLVKEVIKTKDENKKDFENAETSQERIFKKQQKQKDEEFLNSTSDESSDQDCKNLKEDFRKRKRKKKHKSPPVPKIKKESFKSRKTNKKTKTKNKNKIRKVTDFFKILEVKTKNVYEKSINKENLQERNLKPIVPIVESKQDSLCEKPKDSFSCEVGARLPSPGSTKKATFTFGDNGLPVSFLQSIKEFLVEKQDETTKRTIENKSEKNKEKSSEEQESDCEVATKPKRKPVTKAKLSKKKKRKNLKHNLKNRVLESKEDEAEGEVKVSEDFENEEKKEGKKRHNDFERKRRRKINAAYRGLQNAINIIDNPIPDMKITHERTFQVASVTLTYFREALSSLLHMNPTIHCATHLMKRFPELKPLFFSYAEKLSKIKNFGTETNRSKNLNINPDKQGEQWDTKNFEDRNQDKTPEENVCIRDSSPLLSLPFVSPYPPLLATPPSLETPRASSSFAEGNSIPFPFLIFEDKIHLMGDKNVPPFREIVYTNSRFEKLRASPNALLPSAFLENSSFLLDRKENDFNLNNNLNDYLSYQNLKTLREKLFDLKARLHAPFFSPAPQPSEEKDEKKETIRVSSTTFFAPFLKNCFWSELALTFVFPSFSSSRPFRPFAPTFLENKKPRKIDCYCLLFQIKTENSDAAPSTSRFESSCFQETTNDQYGLLLLPEKWQVSSHVDFDDSGKDESQES